MATGKSVITKDGIKALMGATNGSRAIKVKSFEFTEQDLPLNPNIEAKDIKGWLKKDISLYKQIDENTIEFTCIAEPTESKHYTKTCALFLEDGTLFMIAKPSYPFPPLMRQIFKIEFIYQNANEKIDFKYLPHQEVEQDLALLESIATSAVESIRHTEDIELLKRLTKQNRKEIDENSKKIEELEDVSLVAFENSLQNGLEVIKNSELIGLMLTKMKG